MEHKFEVGDIVFWTDPDGGRCSGAYVVLEIKSEEVVVLINGSSSLEVPPHELNPTQRFRVHGYEVIRIPIWVHAYDHKSAITQYNNVIDQWAFRNNPDAESAEECTGYLVDEAGDDEYERSGFYCQDGETPMDDCCGACGVDKDGMTAMAEYLYTKAEVEDFLQVCGHEGCEPSAHVCFHAAKALGQLPELLEMLEKERDNA